MHLVSHEMQNIKLDGTIVQLKKGESITTEYSYKYTLASFADLASDYFEVRKVWTDDDELFSVQYLRVK
jgi:uncharacterized SAM-dependent methyltransferase